MYTVDWEDTFLNYIIVYCKNKDLLQTTFMCSNFTNVVYYIYNFIYYFHTIGVLRKKKQINLTNREHVLALAAKVY